MDVITLDASARGTGKAATKALRREGLVPCVLYGRELDTVHFGVPQLSLRPLIYTHETHRVVLKVDGNEWDCILKHVDFDPVTDRARHADFQVLIAGEKVRITVPIVLEGTPAGKDEGGVTEQILTEIDVMCLPKDMPSNISVNISHLHIGDAIHVSDLHAPGLEFLAPDDQSVVAVSGHGALLEELLAEGEEEEAEEDMEGSEEGAGEEDETASGQ